MVAAQLVAEPGRWPAVGSGAWLLARSWGRRLAAGPQVVADLAAGPQSAAELGCWPAVSSGAWLLAGGPQLVAELGRWPADGSGACLLARSW